MTYAHLFDVNEVKMPRMINRKAKPLRGNNVKTFIVILHEDANGAYGQNRILSITISGSCVKKYINAP